MAEAFPEYSFEVVRVGAGWVRIFVLHKGLQVGRLSLNPVPGGHEVFSVKPYKPWGMSYSAEDNFFLLFPYWHTYGVVPQIDFYSLVEQAKYMKRKKVEELKAWREQNPRYKIVTDDEGNEKLQKKSRPKLSRNWMGIFNKLLLQELENSRQQQQQQQAQKE
jgi:hypothetical protein